MAEGKLTLFPDSNFFIQCRHAHEIDWSRLVEASHVILVVTNPVIREIDAQKGRGNDRVGRRARETSSLFRKALETGNSTTIRQDSPRVSLELCPEHLPSRELESSLDYGDRDDQLVGTVHAFLKSHPESGARLLTYDTGPMLKARMVGVPFVSIPDEWLRPPEASDSEKRIKILEQQVKRLEGLEPVFRLSSRDARGEEIERIDVSVPRYASLGRDDLSRLMEELQAAFPMVNEFGRAAIPRDHSIIDPLRSYVPPRADEIATYQNEEYPAWMESCRNALASCHETSQARAWPNFTFVASNDGARPAENSLVTVEARGHFEILPTEEIRASSHENALPRPPDPPGGTWVLFGLDSIGELARSVERSDALGLYGRGFSPLPASLIESIGNPQRDLDRFYWRDGRPSLPSKVLALECVQWRHGTDEEVFAGSIRCDLRENGAEGLLVFRIQAANLSDPAELRVPVRLRVEAASVLDEAERLVRSLIARGARRKRSR